MQPEMHSFNVKEESELPRLSRYCGQQDAYVFVNNITFSEMFELLASAIYTNFSN